MASTCDEHLSESDHLLATACQFLPSMIMKRRFTLQFSAPISVAAIFLSFATGLWAQSFVAQLSPEARAAVGIDKLTAEERAALEAAIMRYVGAQREQAMSDASHDVREELAARETELSRVQLELAETKTELAKTKEEEKPSMLERASVLLKPGTRIEYSTLESRLIDPFKGWKKGTEFRLENGQIWRVYEGDYWASAEPAGKAVTIEPGMLGSFFIRIEGVRQRARVTLVEGR